MKKITPQQFWELYQKLPRELQIMLLSEETAENIGNVCQKNEIKKEEMETEIAEYVGYVLLGVLPPADFQKILEKEVKLKKEVAEKIAYETARFIFSPIKDSLAILYKAEVSGKEAVPHKKPSAIKEPLGVEERAVVKKPPFAKKLEEVPEEPEIPSKKPDVYRESIK